MKNSSHICLLFESIDGFILNCSAQGHNAYYMSIFVV